jgi:CHAT domain-containing protein
MWELYERRVEAEHYLGPEVRARVLVVRLIGMPAETSEEAFRAELDPLTYADLRAFYNRVVELTGGPNGQTGGAADTEYWQPDRDRLLALNAVGLAAINEAVKARADHLAAQDVEPVRACAAIGKRMENAFRAAYQRRATADDLAILNAAARDYEAIENRASLSEAGRRVLQHRRATALDGLARACETNHRYDEAETHFSDAAALYTRAGKEHLATACLRELDAAVQRHVPDADARLEKLLTRLNTARSPSVDRATVLVDLAELASGNRDDFEAENWLNDCIAELAYAGYPVPDPGAIQDLGDTDRAVEKWIEAIPPGDGEDPMHFLLQINALLPLHHRVAVLRVKLTRRQRNDKGSPEPDVPSAAQAELYQGRLAEIITEAPAHAEAVRARLQAQLGPSAAPGFEAGDNSRHREFMAMMGIVNTLLDLTANSSADNPETITQWRQMADDGIARARAFGQPVPLAQALGASARVEEAADDFDAAIDLYEQAYQHVATVPGKLAADQAIISLSRMAKLQLIGPKNKKAALDTASTAINLIERDRYRVNAPFQQAALLAPHADLFTTGVFAAWKIATDDTAPEPAAYDRMLQLMELSKARSSVRQLFLATARDATELDQKLSALNNEIHELDPVIGPADSAEDQQCRLEQARQAQQPLRRQRSQLWDLHAISRGKPDAQIPPVTLADLQAALEPDEAVIYYYWLLPRTLLVVTITAEATASERKILEPDQRTLLERLITGLGLLKGSNQGLDAAFIKPLAPVLTPVDGQPLLEGKQRLIVSPHRLLHWYPFAAMPYQGQPLVRSFALRYAPNLTSLLVPRPDPGPPRMAALAVSEFPGRPELGELRGVRAEAEDIEAIFSKAGISSALMAEPTRGEVLDAMRDGRLSGAWCLHLATHGHSLMDEISRDAPLESVLELADNSVDGYEIAAADLACEVVVLTACYAGQRAISGRGLAEQPGDELFGLSAAFLDARCRSVLAPAWPADDDATPWIITAFHRNLAEGAPADIALALAQRAFLDTATAKLRRAYYWAPFMLTAIGRPMSIPGSSHDKRSV